MSPPPLPLYPTASPWGWDWGVVPWLPVRLPLPPPLALARAPLRLRPSPSHLHPLQLLLALGVLAVVAW